MRPTLEEVDRFFQAWLKTRRSDDREQVQSRLLDALVAYLAHEDSKPLAIRVIDSLLSKLSEEEQESAFLALNLEPLAKATPSEEEGEFIKDCLTQGRVFRRYGLFDKSIEQFEAVIARDPENSDARRELSEVVRDKEGCEKGQS